MKAAIEKRIEALEDHQAVKEPITIIRIIAMPGHLQSEPDRAEVGGRRLQRASEETAVAFMARVEAEAKLAAKPGCVRVALVFPRLTTSRDTQRLDVAKPSPKSLS